MQQLARNFDEGPRSPETVFRAARVVPEVGPRRRPDDHRVAKPVVLHQPVLVCVEEHRVAVPLHLSKERKKAEAGNRDNMSI